MKFKTSLRFRSLDIKLTRELSRLITMAESNKLEERVKALEYSGVTNQKESFRIGISGPPGAGKSTLIDALGRIILDAGHKLAVLSIDPSSPVSGGSILGDKTRMPYLSAAENAFVRPSPSSLNLGGVASTTPDVINLCESFGYDVVMVETVGVGQSEIAIKNMVDIFVLVLPPASGDELQGIKKGIVEMADIVIVNKCDGTTRDLAMATANDYMAAISFSMDGTKSVLTVSALEGYGISDIWTRLLELKAAKMSSGQWKQNRQQQLIEQFQESLLFEASEYIKSRYASVIDEMSHDNSTTPHLKAINALEQIFGSEKALTTKATRK